MSANALLEPRVDRLEEALIRLAEAQAETQRELADFKNEMRLDFEKYCEENRNEHRKLNQELGRISNKMGTIVEDIIYPATRPLISRYFNAEINDIDIYSNVSRRNANKDREEFDIIASTQDKVFLIEVKSTMRDSYILEFKDKIARFPNFFPEYANKELIPVMASLSMQSNTVHLLTENNIYAMAYREWDYMDMLNFDGIRK